MNWLDSSSFSGLLSQAQKSIDKVLDIPGEDDNTSKKTNQNLDAGASKSSKSQLPKKQDSEKKSSSSWLSGPDSFWGSFTQSASTSSKDSKQTKEKSFYDDQTKNEPAPDKAEDVPPKESKLSALKAMNLKRNNKKKSLKKKADASDSKLHDSQTTNSTQENKAETKPEKLDDLKGRSNEIKQSKSAEFSDKKTGSISNDELASVRPNDELDGENSKPSNYDGLSNKSDNHMKEKENKEGATKLGNTVEKIKDVSITDNVEVITEKEDDRNVEVEKVELTKKPEVMAKDEKLEPLDYDRSDVMEDKASGITYLQNNEINYNNENERWPKFEVDKVNNFQVNEKLLENKEGESVRQQEQEFVAESIQNLDLLSAAPVAASTPQREEPFYHKSDKNDQDDNDDIGNLNELLMASEPLDQNVKEEVISEPLNKADKDVNVPNEVKKVKYVEGLETNEEISDSVSKQDNERLRQVIEVRESKLVELSKENLNLQETNAILRSQIEQLEEVHKSEDAELEQMKEEFTKRIGESDSKLQVAAKERDLFKKQLEETQKCLSSDMERQLKEFQSLLQEKDEQISQLMEEGEKLSKQVLQRNTNIKKLRTKEKELNTSNENLSTRVEEAESEIERLTGILKERDDHEKEQDDAIKKLNAYTKKQEEVIAKQKVELEESAAKLPSLQTALDNAYKEIAELHKVNAAKSTEVQEATLSVEMTAKEELRLALEKLKKESQKECDALAMEVSDLQTQLNRSEQQAARREDNLRQEVADIQMRLQEAETRNQELTQSVSVATRPLLRQIENLQHSYGTQQTSWEKLEKNLTERLGDAQSQLATAQEKERAATERSMDLSSRVASLESQVANYRQEKSRIEAEFELEKAKLEELEDFKSRESGKIEALRTMHSKKLETMIVEKGLLEQQLVVERTKYESEHKKLIKLEEQTKERFEKVENIGEGENEDQTQAASSDRRRSRNSTSSSVFSLSETMTRSLPSGGTAVLEELRATIRHKEGELASTKSAISTLESSRESLTKELTTLINSNENLTKENKQLRNIGKSFQELQTKYNALLQMYGEKQEETEELKLDLQDVKNMYKAQIQELLSGR